MIDSLTFTNFKCFTQQQVPLGKLTLLAGLNGMGKSSVLQGLLLLRQSNVEQMSAGHGLLLNGDLVQMGTARDVLYEHAQEDELGLAIRAGAVRMRWRFSYASPDDDVLQAIETPSQLADLALFGNRFQYLTAERIGPRELYQTSDDRVHRRREIGADGAYAAAFLAANGGEHVEQLLRHPDGVGPGLASQVDAWLGEISPGTRLQAQRMQEINRATLGFEFITEKPSQKQRARSRIFRPLGVGFGLSYALPVLVSVLSAKPSSLLLFENPEAHLHPRGHGSMGKLFALAAAAGIQIIVETHSDHVLNGVRLAVKNGRLPADNVEVHYFTREVEDHRTIHQVVSPKIDPDGRIDHWPEGFFDQWDVALDKLLEP